MEEIGFILLCNIVDEKTNRYWNYSYDCIRRLYPEYPILIILDNTNLLFFRKEGTAPFYKTTIIYSEYPKRGELLPYYYYLHNKLFSNAIIIHDTIFMNIPLQFDFFRTNKAYHILWNFKHDFDLVEEEARILSVFDDPDLLQFHKNQSEWTGCFGAMTVINHDFLSRLNEKYEIRKLIDVVQCRTDRMAFERVIACLLQKETRASVLFGDIFYYTNFHHPTFDQFIENKERYGHLPIVKCFSGR